MDSSDYTFRNLGSIITMLDKAKEMRDEENRKLSFRSCRIPFVDTAKCVDAGLYYWSTFGIVQCAYCFIVLKNWKEGEDPLQKHRQSATTSCTYLNLLDLTKVNDLIQNYDKKKSEEPHNYFMKDLDHRLKSFDKWPESLTVGAISPQNLAKLGLYYLGTQDIVSCFECNTTLGNFKPKDNPLFEHLRWGKSCKFLKTLIDVDKMFAELKFSILLEKAKLEVEKKKQLGEAFDNACASLENPTNFRCIICTETHQINQSLVPCGHCNICTECLDRVMPNCPVCRTKILMPFRIYI